MTDGLVVKDLRVAFGGLVAVDGFSMEVPVGRVTGLIGPNGAGKTTTFNACTGLLRPNAGRVELFGNDVTNVSAGRRARLGLGRTFQRMELWGSLTVRQNVALGREAFFAGSSVLGQLVSSRSQRADIRAATDEALALCDIEALADRPAGALSTGQRRLVELARALAGRCRMLLLDEPSSGLDVAETARMGAVLTELVQARDLGILLVEHDMALVTSVCEYVHLLDFGVPIFEGTVDEMLASPVVRAAYLGTVDA